MKTTIVSAALLLVSSAGVACAQLPDGAPAQMNMQSASAAFHPNSIQPETTLQISAEAQLKREPDIAFISAGVTEERKSAQEAMRAQAAAMNGVFAALAKAKIDRKDIQTSGLSLSPRYDYITVELNDGSQRGEQRLAGYVASNQVTVRVRDLDRLGTIIDSLVSAGGNTFSGVSFAIENDEALRDEARRQAMKNALAKAELYATAAGYRIARIVTITEGYEYAPQPVMMARAEMAYASADAPTPVAGGEVGLTASVNVLFELTR